MLLRRLRESRVVRQGVIWIAVIGGGLLTRAATKASHRSTLLSIWLWVFVAAAAISLVALALSGVYALRGWRRRRQENAGG
jgi:hypothetical protein